jgi:iron complex outermembrane recepter protein
MKQIYSLIVILASCFTAVAQTTSKISGIVQDAEGKNISAATVSLLKSNDSSLVKVSVTDKAGAYEFIGIKEGKYLLSVTSVGYKRSFSKAFDVNVDVTVPSIALVPNSKDLNNVTVTARRPFVETKIDKTVVNVDASPTSAGSTALDVLEKSPGIMVDNDGGISVRGKAGVIVMIDGKQTFLSPTDLANMLRNMPASQLDQIEIMTNPSSKYDASGNSGIINIKTKKGKAGGFNGSIMVGATTSIYKPEETLYFIPKSQNSFNFNYRKNKINFFGNYNPNVFRGRNTMQFEGTFLDNNRNIEGYSTTTTRFKFGNDNHTLKLGLDWFANKKDVLGIVVSGFAFNGHPTPTTIADLRDPNGVLERRLQSYTDNDIINKNFTLNLNWKHTFDSTGKELTADFDYVKYDNLSNMVLTTDYFNGGLQHTGRTFLKGNLPSDINIYTFRSDYTHPYKGGRLEAGVKISYVKNDNLVNYQRFISEKWEVDAIRSNHFIYDENVNAAYVNANKQFGKWSLQGGLRMEHTVAHGNQVVTSQKFKRDSVNFFPTAFVSYAADKKNTVTVSYSRRINRPNYQDLNPFVYFLDTLSFRQGNIYLRPQYSHNIELSHAFMGKFITTLNYNTTDDVFSQVIKPIENSKIRFLTVDNVAQLDNIGLSITAPFTLAKWWNTNVFTNIYNNHYKGVLDTFSIDRSFTSFMVNITNNFTIAKGFTAELSGFYRHRNLVNLSVMDPVYQMSIGLQKQVMQGKGTVRFNVRDPFAWQKFSGYNRYGLIDSDFSFRPDIRQVTATFTWRFGSNNQQNTPRRRAASSQDEQNRAGGGQQ